MMIVIFLHVRIVWKNWMKTKIEAEFVQPVEVQGGKLIMETIKMIKCSIVGHKPTRNVSTATLKMDYSIHKDKCTRCGVKIVYQGEEHGKQKWEETPEW
jgi:hypothetical protein